MADAGNDRKLEEVKAVLRRLQRMSSEGEAGRSNGLVADAADYTKAGPTTPLGVSTALLEFEPAKARSPRAAAEVATLFPVFERERSAVDVTSVRPLPVEAAVVRKSLRLPAMAALGAGSIAIVAAAGIWQQTLPSGSPPAVPSVAALPPVALPASVPEEVPRLDPSSASLDMAPDVLPVEIGPVHESHPMPTEPRSQDNIRAEAAVGAAGAELAQGRVLAARDRLSRVAASASPDVALLLGRTYDPTVLKEIPNVDAQPDSNIAAKWYRTWHERASALGLVRDQRALERLLRAMN